MARFFFLCLFGIACLCGIFFRAILAANVTVGITPEEEELLEWVRTSGGAVNGLTMKTPAVGPRGVYTLRDIEKAAFMMVIPHEVLIHRGFVLDPVSNPAFSDFFLRLKAAHNFYGDDCALLALYLTFENFYNRQRTAISPYLNSLPRLGQFSYLPTYWNADLKRVFPTLQSGNHIWEKRVRNQQNGEKFVRGLLFPFMRNSSYSIQSVEHLQEQFAWANHVVGTRSWGGGLHPKDTGGCTLVPLADMVNHRSNSTTPMEIAVGYDDNTEGFIRIGQGFQAAKEYKAGEEIFQNYAPKAKMEYCNIDFLLNYGFLDPDPDYDCFSSHARLNFDAQTFREKKLELLRLYSIELASTGTVDFKFRGSSIEAARTHFPGKFHTLMRILSVSSVEEYNTGKILALNNQTETARTVWNIDNEKRAYELSAKLVSSVRLRYETTVTKDLALEEEIKKAIAKANNGGAAQDATSAQTSENLGRKKLLVELRRREQMTLLAYETLVKQNVREASNNE